MFCSVPNTPGPLQTLIDNDSVEYNNTQLNLNFSYNKQWLHVSMYFSILTTVLTAPGLCILTPFTA